MSFSAFPHLHHLGSDLLLSGPECLTCDVLDLCREGLDEPLVDVFSLLLLE